jgi:hypothetical protein
MEVTARMPGGGVKEGKIPDSGPSFEPSGRTWFTGCKCWVVLCRFLSYPILIRHSELSEHNHSILHNLRN